MTDPNVQAVAISRVEQISPFPLIVSLKLIMSIPMLKSCGVRLISAFFALRFVSSLFTSSLCFDHVGRTQNMGAWTYVNPRLRVFFISLIYRFVLWLVVFLCFLINLCLLYFQNYIGRPVAASPAGGYVHASKQEEEAFVKAAFTVSS